MGQFKRLIFFTALLLTGCGNHYKIPMMQLQGSQNDNFCGPYALSVILQHAGYSVSEESIASKIFNEKQGATSSLEMLIFAKELGTDAVLKVSNFEEVTNKLQQGNPVLVMINIGLDKLTRHYVVLHAVSSNSVYFNDGITLSRKMNKRKFMDDWQSAGAMAMWIN